MPHKDRAARLASIAAAHARNRPRPTPEPQPELALPPRGILQVSADEARVQCHVCGGWYRRLSHHIKAHGLDAETYKEVYGLPRNLGLQSPTSRQLQRQANLSPEQVAHARASLARIHREKLGRQPTREEREYRLGSRIKVSDQRKGRYRGGPLAETE